jgi:hypothetical protein
VADANLSISHGSTFTETFLVRFILSVLDVWLRQRSALYRYGQRWIIGRGA